MKLVLHVEPEDCAENPASQDGSWTVYEFHSHEDLIKQLVVEHEETEPGLQRRPAIADIRFRKLAHRNKARVGLAYMLSKYEHSDTSWMLLGDNSRYPDWQWDGTTYAGLLVWEHPANHMGAKTAEDRAQAARNCLSRYTAWCNGWVYYCKLTDEDGEDLDGYMSCGNLYEAEEIIDYVLTELAPGDELLRVEGACAFMANSVEWAKLIAVHAAEPAK